MGSLYHQLVAENWKNKNICIWITNDSGPLDRGKCGGMRTRARQDMSEKEPHDVPFFTVCFSKHMVISSI